MKKFMKGCAITALILLILGFALTITAGTVEGVNTISEIVESVTNGKIHFNLGNEDGWGVFLDENWGNAEILYDIDDNMMFDEDYEILYGDIDMQQVGNGVKKLDVDAGGCAFHFEASADENFYIEASGSGKFQCFVKDDTLYVKASHTLNDLDDFEDFEITLYIPENYRFEYADIELGAGQLQVISFATDKMQMEVGAGQITIDYLETDDCNVEVGMGEILIYDMQVTKMNAKVGMGHLRMDGEILGNVSAECSMGAMEINLAGKEEDFNYTLEAAMGNVTIGGADYSGLTHDKTVKNSADKSMDIECAMGNIEVTFEE